MFIQRSGTGPDGMGIHFQLLARQENHKFKTRSKNKAEDAAQC